MKKIEDWQLEKIIEEHKAGYSLFRLANKYNASQEQIAEIIKEADGGTVSTTTRTTRSTARDCG